MANVWALKAAECLRVYVTGGVIFVSVWLGGGEAVVVRLTSTSNVHV